MSSLSVLKYNVHLIPKVLTAKILPLQVTALIKVQIALYRSTTLMTVRYPPQSTSLLTSKHIMH